MDLVLAVGYLALVGRAVEETVVSKALSLQLTLLLIG